MFFLGELEPEPLGETYLPSLPLVESDEQYLMSWPLLLQPKQPSVLAITIFFLPYLVQVDEEDLPPFPLTA